MQAGNKKMETGQPHIIITEDAVWKLLETVPDPEVPDLSVVDLGIIRSVTVSGDAISIIITPTYSGCPAMDVISMDIRLRLMEQGFRNVSITQSLSPDLLSNHRHLQYLHLNG